MNIKLPCPIGSIIKDNKEIEYVVCHYEIRGKGEQPVVLAQCVELLQDSLNDILIRVVDGSFGNDYEIVEYLKMENK